MRTPEGLAIQRILGKLKEEYNYSFEGKTALDFFARDGTWQTAYYADRVKELHAWEIDASFEDSLRLNLPSNSKIKIGDSFELASVHEANVFDIVILDNPQGCYGATGEHCEHFEAIPAALRLLRNSGGLITFNVKTKPFNYEKNLEWQNARNSFYGEDDCSSLTLEFLSDFYRKLFSSWGYDVNFALLEPRPHERNLYTYAAYLMRGI
tara:strand:+ start:6375 stop:7001 length:627 start_codon:yes stop_codon:yes gene_type:complete